MATFKGTPADDRNLRGTGRDDILFGLAGDDILHGLNGSDHLFGGPGDDLLDGGRGRDWLIGDEGADTYRLSAPAGKEGADVVVGFAPEEGDTLDVSPLVEGWLPGVSELDDHVRLEVEARGTQVLVDVDGPGDRAGFEAAAFLKEVEIEDLTPEQLGLPGGLGPVMYFRATTPATGTELYSYDPRTDEISLIEIVEGPGSSDPRDLTVVQDQLYFSASTPQTGYELYRYSPASGKAELVADIADGADSSFAGRGGVVTLNEELYFYAIPMETGGGAVSLRPHNR